MARTIKLLGIQAGKGAREPGAEDGPYELRTRGLIERLSSAGNQVDDLGDIPGLYETRFVHAAYASVNNLPNILQVNRHTHACILGTRRKDPKSFLLVVGGDHSLAIGTLAGLSDACERLGLLWIDAHADFNTPGTSPTGNIHGMSLAVVCGRGHRELRGICDYDPMVEETDAFLFGCRDIDPGEEEELVDSRVSVMSMNSWRERGVVDAILPVAEALGKRCDHVHLSFDIDSLDPIYVPGTGTPVPGGLVADEARTVLKALGRQGVVASAEFVEFNPHLDPDSRTADLTIDLIDCLLR